jgi:hypothetical protein
MHVLPLILLVEVLVRGVHDGMKYAKNCTPWMLSPEIGYVLGGPIMTFLGILWVL